MWDLSRSRHQFLMCLWVTGCNYERRGTFSLGQLVADQAEVQQWVHTYLSNFQPHNYDAHLS